MLRHVAEPFHAGGLEADVGVEAMGDGAVDDGLLLLLQQLDQLLLGADVAPDAPVGVVEEAGNRGLFGARWYEARKVLEVARLKTHVGRGDYAPRRGNAEAQTVPVILEIGRSNYDVTSLDNLVRLEG